MPDNTDAQILQIICRQGRQDCPVDLIFAECRLIPFEAKAPQPTPDVHHRALTLAANAPYLLDLLRVGRQRPRSRRTAEQRDELASSHVGHGISDMGISDIGIPPLRLPVYHETTSGFLGADLNSF